MDGILINQCSILDTPSKGWDGDEAYPNRKKASQLKGSLAKLLSLGETLGRQDREDKEESGHDPYLK
jgi:hypothetical protein